MTAVTSDLPFDPIRAQETDELGQFIPAEIDFWPTIAKPLPITRCVARVRNGPNQGERCKKWAVAGAPVCASHGAQLPVVKQKAEARLHAARMALLELSEDAVDVIGELMHNAAAENVRLKAATEALDRVGVRGGVEITADINVTEADPAALLAERLKKLRSAAAPTPTEEPLVIEASPDVHTITDVDER